jgi:photosystem II stability/assembly factor-like uncharacterized protein
VNGVYKSTDGGANWNAVNTGLTSLYIQDLVMDSVMSTSLYVTCYDGLFKSTDGGENWILVNSMNLYNLVIDPHNPNTLYANSWIGNMAIFKSTDGGGTWTKVNADLGNYSISKMTMDPKSPGNIYLSTDGNGVMKLITSH